jgi:hypothetical protein
MPRTKTLHVYQQSLTPKHRSPDESLEHNTHQRGIDFCFDVDKSPSRELDDVSLDMSSALVHRSALQ